MRDLVDEYDEGHDDPKNHEDDQARMEKTGDPERTLTAAPSGDHPHTPGPWYFMTDSTAEYFAVYAKPQGGTKVICPVKMADEANARLIAAAPDLLAACKAALDWVGLDGDHISEPTRSTLLAAIAKAENRS